MTFNINRFLHQLKWDGLQNYRFLYVGYLVVFGLMLFFPSNSPFGGSHRLLFWFTLTLGGLIYTSKMFDEMNMPQSQQFYLTTPSSHLEKFVSKLSLSTVIFAVVTTVVFTIASWIATSVFEMRVGHSLSSFNPFDGGNIDVIKSYLVLQSIFLLGAIAFRRNSFMKTVGTLFGLGFILSTFWTVFGVGTFSEYINIGRDVSFNFSGMKQLPGTIGESMETYGNVMTWLFWLALAPVMWFITYFKLTEKEV